MATSTTGNSVEHVGDIKKEEGACGRSGVRHVSVKLSEDRVNKELHPTWDADAKLAGGTENRSEFGLRFMVRDLTLLHSHFLDPLSNSVRARFR